MNRRQFIKLIGKTAAAVTLADVAKLVPSSPLSVAVEPVIDWKRWNKIAVGLSNGDPTWFVNGQCVNAFPAIVQKVSQFITIGGRTMSPALTFGRINEGEELWHQCHVRVRREVDPRGIHPPKNLVRYDVAGHVIVAPEFDGVFDVDDLLITNRKGVTDGTSV